MKTTHITRLALVLAFGALAAAGCSSKTETTTTTTADNETPKAAPAESIAKPADPAALGTMPVVPSTPPEHIEVQHVLIGFQGSIPGKTITRTKAEAEKVAMDVLDQARKGANMDQLVQKYTDDQFPGVYSLANNGVTPSGPEEYPRSGMVKGFSDAAFGLSVGNVGIANYDASNSPYGWHIIKRLK